MRFTVSRVVTLTLLLMALQKPAEAQFRSVPIDLPTRPLTSTHTMPGAMAVDTQSNKIYVPIFYYSVAAAQWAGGWGSYEIAVIDGATNTLIKTIPIAAYNVFDAIYNPNDDRVYVATFQGGVQVINTTSDTVVASIPSVPESASLAFDPTTNRLYAGQYRYKSVEVVDTTTLSHVGTIELPEVPAQVRLHRGTQRLFITHVRGDFALSIANATTLSLLPQVAGPEVYTIAMDELNNRVYLGSPFASKWHVFDVNAGAYSHLNQSLPPTGIANDPMGAIVFNPSTNRLHITREFSSIVHSINAETINAETMSVVSTDLSDDNGAVYLAVNPLTGNVYVGQRDLTAPNATTFVPGRIHVLRDGDGPPCVLDVAPPTVGGSLVEGSAATLSSSFSDEPGRSHSAIVSWGDGSEWSGIVSTGPVSLSHVYADNGSYTVTLTITNDVVCQTVVSTGVVVVNVAPVVGAIQSTASPTVGSLVAASATVSDPGADTLSAEWNWGDGIVSVGTISSGVITGDHTYTSNGSKTITLTVSDDDGAVVSVTSTVQVKACPTCNPLTIIGNPTATGLTTTSETITWSTNLPSTSQVEYKEMATQTTLPVRLVTTLTTSHTVVLTDLSPNTRYGFTVTSVSESGAIAQSNLITFSTIR